MTHPAVTDPVESISSPGSRRKHHSVGLFSTGFFLAYIFNETLENLLHIALARRTKRFTLFCARSITCTCRFLLSMVMFIFSHCLLVYQCLKNGSDLYEKDNCIGDSISWDTVLKWRTVQKAKHYGPLPTIFQPLNTCFLFPPCTLSSGTKLMECIVGKTQKKLPRTKCHQLQLLFCI